MPKIDMSATERTDVLAIKASLNTAKDAMKATLVSCSALMDKAEAAGNTADYNAAYLAKERFRRCLADIGIAHALASAAMDEVRNAGPEIFGPGGGRKP